MSMLHYIYDCLLNEFDMRLKILMYLHILDQMYALLSLSVSSQINGEPYWYYEYLIRKSPTTMVSISSWCIFFLLLLWIILVFVIVIILLWTCK